MFFLHARFPLRLDCESWDGEPSLDWAGFVVVELVYQCKLTQTSSNGLCILSIYNPRNLHGCAVNV